MQPTQLGAFPAALNLAGRSVLVIGGSEEAEDKVPKLLRAGARVTLVAAEAVESLAALARTRALHWFARGFVDSDVVGAHVVMLTDQDAHLAARLRALQSGNRFWLCAVDQPAFSDIFLVSTVVQGPVQIGISTGGKAPLLARRIRAALERGLDGRFAAFAHKFSELRASLRDLPKAQRKRELEHALNGFAMEVHVRYPAEQGDDASSTRAGPRDP